MQIQKRSDKPLGLIFNIQEYSVQDGMGIRTTVFLKGCPLKCRWCAKPEGQAPHPELMHSRILCQRHHKCLSRCRHNAVSLDAEGYPVFQRAICQTCAEMTCEKACPEKAVKIVGTYWDAESLYEKISAYTLFYRNSGGGVTLSGGEPLAQPEFVETFLALCEKTGLSVGVETSGLFDWGRVETFIAKFDFIYFDMKCPDAGLHQRVTGCGNGRILENLTRLAGLDPSRIIVTIPVIPGVNTSEGMIGGIAKLCKKLNIVKIRLLPYHPFGEFKYDALGREYLMARNLSVDQPELERYRAIIVESGIDCWVE